MQQRIEFPMEISSLAYLMKTPLSKVAFLNDQNSFLISPSHFWLSHVLVSKGAKIRNRYNQVPRLTQDTNGKVTNSQQTPQTRAKRSALSQQMATKHILINAHKDIANTRQNKNIKDPQKKYRLGTVSKIFH